MTSLAVVACDDGRVRKLGEGWTLLACILWEHGGPSDALFLRLRVDGLEASSLIGYAARALGGDIVILDSITIAGFNLVSPPTVYRLSNAPVIVVYTYKPRFPSLDRAVRNVSLWEVRRRVLKIVENARYTATRMGGLYLLSWGIDIEQAKSIIEDLQIHSRMPEPLRLAHMIASEASMLVL